MLKPLATLATALLLPLTASPAPRSKDKPDEGLDFPATVGTRWVYEAKGGEHEEAITETKADGTATVLTVVQTRGETEVGRSTYRLSRAGLDLLGSGGVTYEKPLPQVRTGAKPGEGWEYTYIRGRTTFRSQLKVVGPERVDVPAGKFDAVRVDGTETYEQGGVAAGGAAPTLSSRWYAPGVGLVKRVWRGEEMTLKSFHPAK
jgi:hypothetical protein